MNERLNTGSLPGFKAGSVGLLGWTNVGKSTLVNHLTGMKIAITANSPQTTRNRLVGIVQGVNYQILLTDTPGIHDPRNMLSRNMIRTTWGTMSAMDVLVWMVFPDKPADVQLQTFRDKLDMYTIPKIILINKMDTIQPEKTFALADRLCSVVQPVALIPVSAKTGMNMDRFIPAVVDQLSCGDPLFPVDQVTDQPERVIAAEYIREQVIENTFQEIPHAVAVEIERFQTGEKNVLEITASIIVEKNSQKGILIGASGSMIKKIGIAARENISQLLDRQVDLRLWIKVNPKWRNDERRLKQMGYTVGSL